MIQRQDTSQIRRSVCATRSGFMFVSFRPVSRRSPICVCVLCVRTLHTQHISIVAIRADTAASCVRVCACELAVCEPEKPCCLRWRCVRSSSAELQVINFESDFGLRLLLLRVCVWRRPMAGRSPAVWRRRRRRRRRRRARRRRRRPEYCCCASARLARRHGMPECIIWIEM